MVTGLPSAYSSMVESTTTSTTNYVYFSISSSISILVLLLVIQMILVLLRNSICITIVNVNARRRLCCGGSRSQIFSELINITSDLLRKQITMVFLWFLSAITIPYTTKTIESVHTFVMFLLEVNSWILTPTVNPASASTFLILQQSLPS